MNKLEVKIERIGINSPYLDAVKKLGRINSKTVAFFKDDTFNDYATSEQMLIAVDDQGNFLGYLLYYASRSKKKFHGDPSDRLIVASSLVHKAPLVTKDQKIQQCGFVQIIW